MGGTHQGGANGLVELERHLLHALLWPATPESSATAVAALAYRTPSCSSLLRLRSPPLLVSSNSHQSRDNCHAAPAFSPRCFFPSLLSSSLLLSHIHPA